MLNKKSVSSLLLAGTLSPGLLSGCGSLDPGSAASASSDETLSFAVVTKQFNMDYWEMVQSGALLAGEEEGIDIQIAGPATEADVTDAAEIIQEAVESGTDGLIVAAADPEYLASTLASAAVFPTANSPFPQLRKPIP